MVSRLSARVKEQRIVLERFYAGNEIVGRRKKPFIIKNIKGN